MVEEIKPNRVYTTEEARDFLKISESTIKRFLKKGVIKAYKIGGRYRICGIDILKLFSPEAEPGVRRFYRKLKDKTKKTIKEW